MKFTVKVECPHCYHSEQKEVTVEELSKQEKPIRCIQCKKRYFIEYLVRSSCSF
jgi:sarcosine oxidase delta subunit